MPDSLSKVKDSIDPTRSEPSGREPRSTTMTAKSEIISAITKKFGLYPTVYRIGLSRTPTQRKAEWQVEGSVKYWDQWATDSLQDAKDIENWGVNTKRMKGGTGGDLSGSGTMYVYVFMP
jgi:hypothetical protein